MEEELLLVDGRTGLPRAVAGAVLAGRRRDGTDGGSVEAELQQEQLETGTRPCTDLAALAAEVRRWRTEAAAAAERVGARVVATGTCPLPVDPSTTPEPRYRRMVEAFGLTAHEQLVCGLHVHVDVDGDEEGVGVLDRIRTWLPVLVALSANSPFWQGRDSGYASFRTQAQSRWPSAGPGGTFGSAEVYHRTVADLVGSGTLVDEGMVYFDARLSARYPTVEVRVADVPLHPDDAVLQAALARALVDTAAREWRAGVPAREMRTRVLRVVTWRASRSGLDDVLVDPRTLTPRPAWDVVAALVEHVRESLVAAGAELVVTEMLARLREQGTGATTQRRLLAETGSLPEVTLELARLTASR